MFRSMPNAFIIDAARPLDEVTQQMKSLVLDALLNRNTNRNEVPLIVRI